MDDLDYLSRHTARYSAVCNEFDPISGQAPGYSLGPITPTHGSTILATSALCWHGKAGLSVTSRSSVSGGKEGLKVRPKSERIPR